MNLERAVEAYNAATDKLDAIQADLRVNARELQVARVNLRRSQRALERRLVIAVHPADRPLDARDPARRRVDGGRC